jgi:hypothetical protein
MMPSTSVPYPVDDASEVSVDVLIGDGQIGGSSIFVGQQHVATGDQAMRGIRLGRGAELRGQVAVVSTTVVDVRPEHDRVSTLVELHGGFPDPMPVVQAATAKPSNTVNFLTVIRFV